MRRSPRPRSPNAAAAATPPGSRRVAPGRWGRAARILATVLITAGLVVLLDVGVTLAWGEPVSAVRGWLAQRDAAEELAQLERRFRPRGESFDPGRVPALATRFAAHTGRGDALGQLRIPRIDLSTVVFEGTDTLTLERGPGHYPATVFPGQPGTVAFAGHRTTYLAPFRHLDAIGRGDEIVLAMPYATFTYRFERQRIVDPSQVGVVRDVGHDRIVLTACHPLYSAAQRIVVFARLTDVGSPASGRTGEPAAAPDAPPFPRSSLAGMAGLAAIAVLIWFLAAPRGGRQPQPWESPARSEGLPEVQAEPVEGLANLEVQAEELAAQDQDSHRD